jgi:redox-sensitive bicupin YhaK (pirin superfamily)
MSGPIRPSDAGLGETTMDVVVVREGRRAEVGGLDIVRVLPTKGRRTVGPWCFVDLMRPPDVDHPDPMEIGPHPHIGLSTVTWLYSGEAVHTDSLGTEQLIRPGELNLMSAGHGIAHAEQALGPNLHGAQMWLAQPEGIRHGDSGFEHHGDLPVLDLGGGEARVIIGTLDGTTSPARQDWETVGADIRLRRGSFEIPVASHHEHAIAPIDHPVLVNGEVTEPGFLALVPAGREAIHLDVRADDASVMLIGGEPLGDRVYMWWNFVARTRDEVTEAWRAWEDADTERFGAVPTALPRIEAPRPPWLPAH